VENKEAIFLPKIVSPIDSSKEEKNWDKKIVNALEKQIDLANWLGWILR